MGLLLLDASSPSEGGEGRDQDKGYFGSMKMCEFVVYVEEKDGTPEGGDKIHRGGQEKRGKDPSDGRYSLGHHRGELRC